MDTIIEKLNNTILHINTLHETFKLESNFSETNHLDHEIYIENLKRLNESLHELNYEDLLYMEKGRQMILSDFFEYIFFGRVSYSLNEKEDRGYFIKAILSFVNMLMCFESLTVSDDLRKLYLQKLGREIPEITIESNYNNLLNFRGKVGLTELESDADRKLNDYFDTLLPKTAGGLWHELLSYIFLLRNNVGYIIPLLLSQKLVGLNDHIVPPDFLILSREKRLYGIEVGGFKERQSSNFVLRTAIPTASIDTRNSRTDRCPICKKWINFCPYVINSYSDVDHEIGNAEVRCLKVCNLYNHQAIAAGKCPYTKYSRNHIQADHGNHDYADGLHYHYQCVLSHLPEEKRNHIITAEDEVALKNHYPFYSGLEGLINYA